MVGLRVVVVFLSVLAIATPCLIPIGKKCACHKKEPVIKPCGHPISKPRDDGVVFRTIDILIRSLGGIVKNSKLILIDILHLKLPGCIDDVFLIIISLGRALGWIIEIIIPGLGVILGNLVIYIVKVIICIGGSPGLIGGLLGGLLGGKRPDVCGPDYGCKWGWKRYPGSYKDHRDLLKHYELTNVLVELELIKKKCSKGRNGDSYDIISIILFEHIRVLVDLVNRNSSSWCKDDMITLYIHLTVILGALGNSCKSGMGDDLIDEIESFCWGHFKNNGFKDIKEHNSYIKQQIKSVKCWEWKGVISQSDSSDTSDQTITRTDTSEESKNTKTNRSDEKSESNDKSQRTDTSEESNDTKTNRSDEKSESNDKSQRTDTSEESNNTKTNRSDEKSKSNDKSQRTDCDSKDSSTDKSGSDDSNSKRGTKDGSEDSSNRGKEVVEEVSASKKVKDDRSSKTTNDEANVDAEKREIDISGGNIKITDERLVASKKSSTAENKSSYGSDEQFQAKKVIKN